MRLIFVEIIVVLLLMAGFYVWPLVCADFVQDACRFGRITNSRYLEMLAASELRLRESGGVLDVRSKQILTTQIQRLIEEGITEEDSADQKIAAIHAALRSVGGVYRSTVSSISARQPERNPALDVGITPVSFLYYIDANFAGRLELYRRWIRVIVWFRPQNAAASSRTDEIQVAVLIPQSLDPSYATFPRSRFGEVCPPVPVYEKH